MSVNVMTEPINDRNTKTQRDRRNVKDFECGIGSCRPQSVQRCSNMTCFTIFCSVAGLVTSSLVTYVDSQITTLEKYFNISSSISGFLASCNDIGYLTTTLFLSYLTRRIHIPRGLAGTSILYGFSGLFCTVAFFASRAQIPSPPQGNTTSSPVSRMRVIQTCSNDSAYNRSCEKSFNKSEAVFELSNSMRTASVVILAVGMMLQGVAKSPRQAFIGTYVDDNVVKIKTPMYVGMISGISSLGPAMAFVLGSVFSNMYITLEETSLSLRDPRWLGAWWLGFLVFGLISLVVAVPLIFFPKRMRRQQQLGLINQGQNKECQRKISCSRDCKGALRCLVRLVRKPAYVFTVLGRSFGYMAISGMVTFLAKYLESQFTMTPGRANMVIGILNLLMVSSGFIISGCLTSRLKLSPLACLQVVIGSMTVVTVVMFLGLFVGCEQPVILSGSQTFSPGGRALSPCLETCNCDHGDFFPVCGSDNRNYFSPCHAGCLSMETMTFSNCSCLDPKTSQTARGGLCAPECNSFYPYMALVICLSFFSCFTFTPTFVVIIRSVQAEDIPVAIGFSVFAATLLGFTPGPVIFGFVVDTTCILWKQTCTFVGTCALYDIELFRFRYHLLILGLHLSCVVCYVLVLVCAKCSKTPVFQPHDDEITNDDEEERHEFKN